MKRRRGTVFALVAAAIGVACLVRAGLTIGPASPLADPAFAALRLAALVTAGLFCLAVAWRFRAGAGGPADTSPRTAPLFGRQGAPVERDTGHAALAIVPLLATLGLGADFFLPPRTPEPAPVAAETPPKKPDPAPAQQEVAPQDTGTTDGTSPDDAAPPEGGVTVLDLPPPPELSAPPPDLDAPPTSSRPAAAAAPVGEPATVATAPGTAEPPVTTAPPVLRSEPQPTAPDGHSGSVVWLSVAPDGQTLLSASIDQTIKLWDLETNALIRTVGAHKDMARTALFLPDGARALTAGDDGEVVLRSLGDGAVLRVFSAAGYGGANKVALSRDGRIAVSGHQSGAAIVWDVETGKGLHVLADHDWSISGVAIAPDGGRAVTGSIDGKLDLWDLRSGTLLRTWQGHDRGTYGIDFTPDGHHLVTGSGDLTIKLWDLDTGREVRRFTGHSGTVYALVLSPDGKRILSGSLDRTARLWNLETGDEIAQFIGHRGPVHSVAFAADGSVLTAGGDRTIRSWPAAGGASVVLIRGAPGEP